MACNGSLGGASGPYSVGPDSKGWKDDLRRGAMGANVSIPIDGARDGTSNTLLIAEVRVGYNENDRRGTWAMGNPGASALFLHGFGSDNNGPNNCWPQGSADDIENCNKLPREFLIEDCMSCYSRGSWSAAPRSRHSGGMNIALMDGSTRFITDYIETSGRFGKCCAVWDRLIASSDGQVIAADAF